jgi:hypothetical protein
LCSSWLCNWFQRNPDFLKSEKGMEYLSCLYLLVCLQYWGSNSGPCAC